MWLFCHQKCIHINISMLIYLFTLVYSAIIRVVAINFTSNDWSVRFYHVTSIYKPMTKICLQKEVGRLSGRYGNCTDNMNNTNNIYHEIHKVMNHCSLHNRIAHLHIQYNIHIYIYTYIYIYNTIHVLTNQSTWVTYFARQITYEPEWLIEWMNRLR